MATIPMEEVARLNLGVGDVVSVELKPVSLDFFGATKGKLGPYHAKEDRWDDRE
ncbi:MAG: hypothetical protein V1776_05495 [Candidatus Diapherotrites archaeon]